MTRPRHVVITGAGGFIGARLVERLLSEPDFTDAILTLADVRVPKPPADSRVRVVEGDLCCPEVRAQMIDGRAEVLFHLAGVLGGAAEADYALGRKVNLEGTLDLFEAVRDEAAPPRVVFASSVAVFGPPLPAAIDDDTLPIPFMHYGGQKRMMEVALEQLSAHGWIDGIAIRLPGIIARPGADARMKAAFVNRLFYNYAAGVDFSLPVSPHGTMWLISVPACVEAFVHAARVPSWALGARRAFNLPAQRVSMAEVVEALKTVFPQSRSQIAWEPDEALENLFTRQPPLATTLADSLGFQHDGSLERLVQRAIQADALHPGPPPAGITVDDRSYPQKRFPLAGREA